MTTSKASLVTGHIRQQLEANARTLGLKAIYYGDQEKITASPALCVIPATKKKMWSNTGLQVATDFELSLLIYSTSITASLDDIQAKCDAITEEVEDFIDLISSPESNGGTQLGGLITQGLCTGIEYGYKRFNDKLVRMNRIIYQASSARTPIISGS